MLGVSDSMNSMPATLASGVDQESAVAQADGSLVVTSPGGDVVATHSDPLPATTLAVAVLPDVVEVAMIVPVADTDLAGAQNPVPTTNEAAPTTGVWSDGIASAGSWTVQMVETGRAVIDLDPEYRLSINDVLAEVILQNRSTNVMTRIWGNAQVEVAGQSVGQFWGTSSFQLANGTLITANTIVSPDNSSAYMLERLIVTRDACGLVVTGISNATVGDVAVALAANATVFDRITPPTDVAIAAGASVEITPAVSATPIEREAAPNAITEAPSESVADGILVQQNTATEPAAFVEVHAPAEPLVTPSTPETVAVSSPTEEQPLVEESTVLAQTSSEAPLAVSVPPAAVTTPAPILVENLAPSLEAARARIDGYDMDDDHRDGLVFEETATGWIEEWDSQAISVDVLAQTQPGQTFGPNSDIMSRTEFGAVISRFISIMASQGLANLSANRNSIFESQLRDIASQSDSQHAAKQAAERAARDRRAVVNMLNAGIANATTLHRYHA